jgi:MoaA/NifB/PqqE/SkfB family radical SAM enzyme
MKGATNPDSDAWTRQGDRMTAYSGLKKENSRLLIEDITRRSTVFRGLPEIVILNHTDICNLRCVMCVRHLFPGNDHLERNVLECITERLFPTAWKAGLAAAQAEPMMVDFEFLVEKALKFGVYLDVVTNGTLLTADRYREARAAIDYLEVSLDTPDPAVYESIRLGARFDEVYGNLCSIRDERLREPDDVVFTISAVVMKSNLYQLPALVRFAHDMGAAAVMLHRLRHDVKYTPEEEPFDHIGSDRMVEVFQQCSAVARELGISFCQFECKEKDFKLPMEDYYAPGARLPRGRQLEGMGLCWYLAQAFYVLENGEVHPCIIPTQYTLGNVLDEDPVAIWNGAGFQWLREAHFSLRGTDICSKCGLAPHLLDS